MDSNSNQLSKINSTKGINMLDSSNSKLSDSNSHIIDSYSKTIDSYSDAIDSYSEDFGILLISHGSSLPYAEKTFKEIHKKFIAKTGYTTEVGYMKVAEPSISQAITNLTNNNMNIKKIIAMPVFLAPGIHTNIDIPIILGLEPKEIDPRCPDGNYPNNHYLKEIEKVNFNGEINLINCIGPDPMIIDIIHNRIKSAIDNSDNTIEEEKTAILLVSHGSRLNYNREFITEVYNQYKTQASYTVGQGFMELCEPTIAQTIDSMTKEKDFDRLIVVPVFLAPGVHTTRDIPGILGILKDNGNEDSHNHHSNSHSHNHNHSHNSSHSHSNNHDSHNHHSNNHDHNHTHGGGADFDGEILYTEPLGADDLIIEIIKQRIENEI